MEARFGRGRDRVEAVWRGRIDELRASWLSILQVGVATSNLSVSAIVSQVRSIAVDPLRTSGVEGDAALAAVRRPDLPSLDLG